MSSVINVPGYYPEGCSDELIKNLITKFQKQIVENNYKKNPVIRSNDYPLLIEQGNKELDIRLQKRLISNLEKSSTRQRELTWAIIIIGGANLVLAFLKLFSIIN